MTSGRDHVVEVLTQNRDAIRGFGVRRLALFGSCARAEETASSDLDFVVELETKSFDAYMDLKLYLEELFGCPVDLVLQHTIKPRLRSHIMEELIDVPGL